MAGRGMLFAEGPTACPFVALESDRDRRAGEPDPRHRCYAEPTPAPRALAHQREFCLSPQFGGCPIFQDWAVRAAARPVPLRPLGAPVDQPPAAASGPEQLPAFEEPQPAAQKPAEGDSRPAPPLIPPPYGGTPREAQPDALSGRSLDPQPIERIPSMPLNAGATGDDEPSREDAEGAPGVAHEPRPDEDASQPSRPATPAVAVPPMPPAAAAPSEPALPSGPTAQDPPRSQRRRWTEDWPPSAAAGAGAGATPPEDSPARTSTPPGHRSQIEVGRPLRMPRGRREERPSPRDEWSAQRADLIPAWERQRYAAYPGLMTRLGVGDGDKLLSRLTRILAIIAIAALVIALLLLAPGFFAGGPVASPTATASPSPTGPTSSPTPSLTPQPTVSLRTYVVQAGDSLSAIAAEFGLLICQVQAANPEITDPNDIFIGQVIRIPPDDFALDECLVTPAASP